MRLVSFVTSGQTGWGLHADGSLHPVNDAFRAEVPGVAEALAAKRLPEIGRDTLSPVAQDAVDFLPPVPAPGRILCIGMNYSEHIREMGREPPEYPAMFVRFPDSLVGHHQPIIRPRVSTHYDFEGELAVVIGRRARHVSREEAMGYVGGYTCLLDGSVRDFQRHTSQFTAGKNFTGSGAMGPCLVTSDEIPDPRELVLETYVNDERMQHGEVSDLCIDIPETISYLSQMFPLNPGDVISTGTPSGVGAARTPPIWLQPGDRVRVNISVIGDLENTVADEPA
jgi:2-keto-4-pentenoate hydratase/2-oxohepta-3-ene-1,7-dioic acid hydratase in catechol pathway